MCISIEVLKHVNEFFHTRGIPCFLVGGLLRDQLLKRARELSNVDLAIPSQSLALSRALAAQLGGAFVPLDEDTGTARVVVNAHTGQFELDISDFRGPNLETDLRRRDFTVNAIAIALGDWLRDPGHPAPLIDPLAGQQALRDHQLVPCFSGAFEEDPLRILRAYRFVAQLEFLLDPAALPLLRQACRKLVAVSGERIREELIAIFDTDRAAVAMRALNDCGALDVLFPELSLGRGVDQGGFHHLDVLGHELETVAQADQILRDFQEFSEPLRRPLVAYCAGDVVAHHARKSLIKLAGLLHDIGKPAKRTVQPDGEIWFLGHEDNGAELATAIVARLKLSNRESAMVCQLVRHHLRPGFLSREPQLTRRAIYRFFRDLGEDGPACLLTWWADRMATRGAKSHLDQIDQQRARLEELLSAYFFKAEEVVKPPRLIDGRRLMDAFRLGPGPLIGELLQVIEEAQAEGRIHTADDALALARQHLAGKRA